MVEQLVNCLDDVWSGYPSLPRSNHNKAACALANKLARICYAILRYGTTADWYYGRIAIPPRPCATRSTGRRPRATALTKA